MAKRSKDARLKQLLRLGIGVALIALIAMVGAVMAGAEEPKYSEGLKFTSNGDGTCSVSGIGTCTDTEIVIPPVSPEGDAVTSIGALAFKGNSIITGITIPNGVTSIGNYAIHNCSSLTSITIPDSVIRMGTDAFKGCSKVIETYNGLKYVDKWVVGYVSGITEAVFRQDAVGIADWAFSDCDSLTNISIPQSVTNIGMYAFYNCGNLLSVIIPECVTKIDDGTFSTCENLKSIHIPEGVTSIGDHAFAACRSLTSINIPENVTSIGEGAFNICEKITSIYIPKNVNSIGDSAFGYCYNLRRIDVSDGNIRYHSSGNCLIDSLHKTIIAGCRNSTIPKDGSVIHIGDYAFCGCHYLSSITIPDCVTSIGDYAFQSCNSLTRIHIPKDVVYISSYAFGCANLSRITVAEENPVYHSAGNCLIETASKTLVAGCYNSTIPADGSVTSIGDYAFYGRKKMTNIVIPESVISIGNEAFSSCKGLTSIIIPAGVKSIGYSAFSNCGSLKSITIPEGVTNIGKNTFIGCSSLESVTIPKSVTSIGYSAFYFCENLTDIAIPDGVKYIGISAFGNCSSLTGITIPHSVTSIEPSAFAGCESLADVYYKGTEEQWNLISISNDNDWLLKATIHFLGEPIKKDVYFDLLSGLWLDQNGNPAQGIAVCLDSETRYCHAGKPQRKGAATDPDGYIYYFNSALKAVRNTTYTIGESMANGIIPAGTYNVDAQGRLMDGRGELLRADTAMADGFKYFADGTIRYYVDGKPARAGLVADEEGNYYYFNSSLKAVCGTWYEIGESMTNGLLPAGKYFFDESGKLLRADTAMTDGFKYFADGTIRYYVDGKPARAGLVTDEEGNYYYFNSSLKAVCGTWYEIGESMTNGLLPAGKYFFDESGKLLRSDTAMTDGFKYFADGTIRYYVDGKPARAGLVADEDGYLYYFNSYLRAARGEKYTIGESMTNGLAPAGDYNMSAQGRLMDGRGELLRADTAMADGFKYFADGTIRYYVDGKPARAGLVTDEEGDYYYFNSSLKAVCEAWYEIGESMTNGLLPAGRYYFNGNGTLILS